jgi:glycopeptide antibiotics resistance protein
VTQSSTVRRRHALLAVVSACICVITLAPRSGTNEEQWRPFVEIGPALAHPLGFGFLVNVIGNILLFAPFGAALALLGERLWTAVLTGFFTSAAIEIVQVFVPGRTSATDDMILNTLGTLVGYLLVSRVTNSVARGR